MEGGAGKRVRIGIIGAGSWAVGNHVPILKNRSDVELVVACRKGNDLLNELRSRFGFEHVTEDYREALSYQLDAVVVASPVSLHYEHTHAALHAGANVLCEKPFTISPKEAWELDATARQLGRHLLLAFGWNYRPTVIQAKKFMTEQGGVGKIEHVMISMASGTRELLSCVGGYAGADVSTSPESDTWTDPAISGGGYAQAQLSHALGIALWLTGDRGKRVFAFMNNVGRRVELHDAISIQYESGATGVLSGASCPAQANAIEEPDAPWPRHQVLIRIYGSEGQVVIDLERDFLWLFREGGEDKKGQLPPHAGLYACDAPPNRLVDLTLGRNVANCSSADLGARVTEILHAAYRSNRIGQPIELNG